MEQKRITIFAGHYGSGKTNIAVNYAKHLHKTGFKVSVADLDIVNPYFRTKDSSKDLEDAGIKLICSPYANSNVDVPALPQELYSVIDDTSYYSVLDVGGDDRGALALGRFVPALKIEDSYEMLLVINCFRPLSRNPEDTVEIMREIEAACGLKFTGIANNSNLGEITTADDILSSVEYAEKISECTGLPIRMTCVKDTLAQDESLQHLKPFSLQLQDKHSWL